MANNNGIVSILNNIRRLRRPWPKPKKEDLFVPCDKCNEMMTKEDLHKNHHVCTHCGHNMDITPKDRLDLLLDSYRWIHRSYKYSNPLDYPQYSKIKKEASKKSGAKEAIVVAQGVLHGTKLIVCILDKRYMMGSMGTYVGDELCRAFGIARSKNMPIIVFSASGGARMQEGIYSLMQMAKTAISVKEFQDSNNLFISVMTHPTTGGVTASFASLGDIIIGEPGALIGFAGPRVIKQTIGESLPEGFQKSEFVEEKGFLDSIVSREEQRNYLGYLLRLHNYRSNYDI